MKRRNGNLFRRLMAMILVTVLVVGLTQGAVPVSVLAQESVSGNDAGVSGAQESVSENDAKVSGPQESVSEDEEDIESEGVEEIAAAGFYAAAMSLETVSAVPGTITSDQTWGEQTLPEGNYTINQGVTVTLTGQLTLTGNVTINGGGTIVRDAGYIGETSADKASLFYMSSGTLTLENITVDGNLIDSNGPAIYMNGGTVNLQSGAVIQNNKNMNTHGTGRHAGGGIYCGSGILNINGGTIQNCSTREGGSGFSHAGGGIYLKGTCNMTSGSITGNRGSNGGGIYLASAGAELNLTGGTIFGNSAENYGDGIYYSTVYDANSRLLISGNTDVSDIIYLDNTSGSLSPLITSELQHAIYLSCSSREEGRVLAQGSGYTLTDADVGKVSMEDTNLHSKLDGRNNTIVLRVIHTHGVSGGSGTQETFIELNDNAATLSSGSYYLTGDMALNSPLTVPSGAVVNLCLNGYKLEYSGSEKVSVIVVEQGGTLNLCDCNGSHGSHTFISPATGQAVTVAGGLVTRSTPVDMVGSGIHVKGGGTCNFYGGSVAGLSDTGRSGSGNIDSSHGAVRVEGVFHMYGGAIAHNRSGCGGGVNICSINSNDACFYLHGGSIANNYADYDDGGGICLNGQCSFVMEGGEIRNNRAQSGGGGIECYGNGDSADRVRLTGGTITGNTTGGDVGGGIRCGDAGRPLTVSGSVRITGNTNGSGEESNLYLCNHKTMNIDGGLSGSAMIGVTTEKLPTSGNPVSITGNNNADCTAYFISDESDYSIADGTDHQVQLVYEPDADKAAAAKTVVEQALENIMADNDMTRQDIQDVIDAALNSAGITDVTVTVGEISKTEATTSAEGSISGTIAIACGSASDSVTISKTIAKLQVSDADKIEAAKNAVRNALKINFTPSNDTTKQDIQTIIDTALSEAGIADVAATIVYLSKMDATTSEEGWIGAQIEFQCGSKGDSLSLGLPIAKLPESDEGEVVKDVQTDGKAPATQLSTPADQLADMILTPEEKQQLTSGTDIKIVLDVKDASESVSGEDKALVEAALHGGNVAEGFVMGQYLDISLFKIIGENRSAISTINGKLNITIIVPENLKTTDSSITRTFAVIRVHNGGVDLLNDMDNSADTITIETDRFSTYAIVYKDTSNGGNGNGGGNNNENSSNSNSNNDGGMIHNNQINENGGSSNNGGNADNDNSNDYTGDQNQKDDEPKTGDNTPLELYATLAMIFGVSNLLFIKKSGFGAMTEEKKKELVARLILWGKRGGKIRRYAALSVIMILAVYYHAIGKNIAVEWNENYEG